MGLDYGHTCPDIDKNIGSFKETIEGFLSDFLDDVCPLLNGTEEGNNLIDGYVNSIYDECSNIFEDTRSCNEDMRKEANKQIEELESQRDYMQEDLDDNRVHIENIEYDLSTSEERVRDLENELSQLEEEEL